MRIAKGGDGIGALVVSENEQHVGWGYRRLGKLKSPRKN
jgi:hypothetical protein